MFRKAITGFLAPGVLALGLLGLAAGPALAQGADDIQALRSEIETLKEGQATIQKNLEEILTILEPMKRRAQAQKFEPKDVDLAGAANKGAIDAPVTLVEFTDYQCPFCRRHFSTVMPRIEKEYVATGKLRYVLKEFPIPSLHPGAPKAAEGALCAGDQEKYWEMHDAIFKTPKAVAPEQLKDKAAGLGLDLAAFSDCLDSSKYRDKVRADMAEGRPRIWVDFLGYDEVAHHSGIERADSLAVLRGIDRQLGRIDRAREWAGRPYRILVLSDHGQSQGATFRQRTDKTLEEVVRSLCSLPDVAFDEVDVPIESRGYLTGALEAADTGGGVGAAVARNAGRQVTVEDDGEAASAGDGPMVLASGNLALVYFPDIDGRATLEELERAHPGLVAGLLENLGAAAADDEARAKL